MQPIKDSVYVAVDYWKLPPNMSTLEWALNHFDKYKTKLILTCRSGGSPYYRNLFINLAESTYRPRCIEAQFEVEILAPQVGSNKEIILELLTQHEIKRLVVFTASRSEIEQAFRGNPNLSCKTWLINCTTNKLEECRQYGPDPLQEAQKEIEEAKRMAKEETERRKNLEQQLATMTEQTKINEKKNDQLTQENEQLKKMANEEAMRCKIIEEKLIIMTEQAHSLNRENEQLKQNMTLSTHITFQELEEATNNFSDSSKIGEGGIGNVYKGIFRGTTVTIKKFKNCDKTLSDFQKEVQSRVLTGVVIMSTVRHPNLVTLIGTCSKPLALVYEFLPNGSLYDYLNNTGMPLLWQTRTRIISEICLALIFLHSNKPNPIIHGDLRPDNVFLDGNYTSKLSDFGVLKHAFTNYSINLFGLTDPDRLIAYMDPEFFKTRTMTSESDVYSFGMIIIRLLTGETSVGIREAIEKSMENDEFHAMIDESAGKWPLHEAKELVKIGIWCASESRSERPDLVNDVWPIIERVMTSLTPSLQSKGSGFSNLGKSIED